MADPVSIDEFVESAPLRIVRDDVYEPYAIRRDVAYHLPASYDFCEPAFSSDEGSFEARVPGGVGYVRFVQPQRRESPLPEYLQRALAYSG